ncbi:hypothetical protein AA23498_2709 [Acetobacter nitrogenifigens DSM 23921 = NBRC 105050]|uniref:Transglycosylase SLT domain-containing protein n=1 Tax=Acetobacter nitrogenifigens DSM 23921 = NBRC 105050 TaxID=1120919 RepID=A0A511XEW6_9PROT|nr:hypothetical protein AA23498_2709 [Acetobacter nitrogenifigens DSM 23921 = NBRC 105050]GEN61493.1 hypothetical protein ANI02nite_33770 [Acetobacter nitrogenifigens DSM 23921 = NBRC 105050]
MIYPAAAQTVNVPSGLPPTVNATWQEIGMGDWTPPTSSTTQQISGSGSVVSTTTSSGSDTDALQSMYSQSWGYAAAQNASALGVNPNALAATCVVESGCQNVNTAGGGNTITGAFQMSNGTYSEELQKALASDPSLAASITDTGISGQQDPATQAVAAAQYLKDAATSLQKAGISDPTALDTRAYYNFGPQRGAQIATANDSALMSSYVPSNQLASNGISSGETVGQWKSSVAAKMGSAASSPILSS